MTKKDIIRVDDKVRIINPEFFVRCGYENNRQSHTERIEIVNRDDIIELIKNVFPNHFPKIISYSKDSMARWESVIHNVAKALAYEAVHENMKSGEERKIFTSKYSVGSYFGNDVVTDIKYVKTGTYIPPHIYHGVWDDDYEPGGLLNEKVHKILQIDFDNWIEDINVEKVND